MQVVEYPERVMRRALTIAFGVHAIVVVGLTRISPVAAPTRVLSNEVEGDAAMEIVTVDDIAIPRAASLEPARPEPTSRSRMAARGPMTRAPTGVGGTATVTGLDAPPAAAPAESEPPSAGRAPLSAEQLGLAGPNRFLTMTMGETEVPREDEAHAISRRANAVLRAPSDERATELGLGPDGPVRTALTDATSQGLAPVKGRARFQVLADAQGIVVDVRLLDTNGGRDGWQDAAERAKRALAAGPRLRMPSSARGAEMTFEVTSASQLPSGQAPGTQVHVLGRRVKKGEDDTSTDVRFLEPPKIELVDIGQGVKLPIPVVGLGLVGTTGDPTNIGATARRVVHTKLLSTRYL